MKLCDIDTVKNWKTFAGTASTLGRPRREILCTVRVE